MTRETNTCLESLSLKSDDGCFSRNLTHAVRIVGSAPRTICAMGLVIGLAIAVGAVAVLVGLTRHNRSKAVELGVVSASWINEHRAADRDLR